MANYNGAASNASRLSFQIIMGVVIGVVVLIVGAVIWNVRQIAAIDTFEECAKKYAVLTSYPQQCRTPDGRIFTEDVTQKQR